jgi:hypothetical protein
MSIFSWYGDNFPILVQFQTWHWRNIDVRIV